MHKRDFNKFIQTFLSHEQGDDEEYGVGIGVDPTPLIDTMFVKQNKGGECPLPLPPPTNGK